MDFLRLNGTPFGSIPDEPRISATIVLSQGGLFHALPSFVAGQNGLVLLLDSWVPGRPHGLIEAPTLQWLDAALASSADRPALLFLRHLPFIAGIRHMDRQNLRNSDELASIIGRHKRVRIVATGHVHRAALTMFAGVPCTICPAPNHAVDLNLARLRAPSFRVEHPAFHLHTWFEGAGFGQLVTHPVPIGEFDGPYPFFGADGKLL